MLRLIDNPLPERAVAILQDRQARVDAQATFPEKVAEGKRLFTQYNKNTDIAFREVRRNLVAMSGGTVRCNYCEALLHESKYQQ